MTSTQPSADAVGTPDGVIHTEDLTKVYAGTDLVAVDKLSLDVQAGEIFGLLGRTGQGRRRPSGC